MPQNRIWKDKFTVKTYEVNLFQELDIVRLLDRLQDAASRHAETLGFGWEDMQDKEYFWVLSRFVVEIDRVPKWNDKLILHSWPKDFNKLAAYRDFEIFDEAEKNILIKATSMWMVLNSETHRPTNMMEVITDDRHTNNRIAIEEKPARIRLPKEKNLLGSAQISINDLDMNKHANNVAYVRKLKDAYSLQFVENHKIKRIELNFTKEALYGQKLQVYIHNSLEENTHFLSIGDEAGDLYLAAKFEWFKI